MLDFYEYLLCEIRLDEQEERARAYHIKTRKRRKSLWKLLQKSHGKRSKHGRSRPAFPTLPEARFDL